MGPCLFYQWCWGDKNERGAHISLCQTQSQDNVLDSLIFFCISNQAVSTPREITPQVKLLYLFSVIAPLQSLYHPVSAYVCDPLKGHKPLWNRWCCGSTHENAWPVASSSPHFLDFISPSGSSPHHLHSCSSTSQPFHPPPATAPSLFPDWPSFFLSFKKFWFNWNGV